MLSKPMRKTKIICTLGPATDDDTILREMMRAGMDVARFNFSHGSHAEHAARVARVKRLRQELDIPVALMMDTQGPDVRVCGLQAPFVRLVAGAQLILTAASCAGTDARIGVTYPDLPAQLSPGQIILLDDGLIRLRVLAVRGQEIETVVEIGGQLAPHKSLNVPGHDLDIPYVRPNDLADLAFAAAHDFDFVAASFARTAADILDLRAILAQHGAHGVRVIAKIENAAGIANCEELIDVADGIMVARGDLGVEIDYVEIPSVQKDLIKSALAKARISVVATQMLESMIHAPRPTRAEISDVANAIYDGTSAIMLSGETSIGSYPVEAVAAMANIAERTERDIDYRKRFSQLDIPTDRNITDAVSHATCLIAHQLSAAAIVTPTQTGTTAMVVSRYRPFCPIIACTPDPRVHRQLSLSWGVVPMLLESAQSDEALRLLAIQSARASGWVQRGDVVITTAGIPLGISGKTNTIRISEI